MNLSNNPTIEQLRGLLAAQNDDQCTHILYVTREGEVKIAKLDDDTVPSTWAYQNEATCQFRLESFQQGNGYVGPEAASSSTWPQRLLIALQDNWLKKSEGYIDNF